ncbi:hypothetical protein [Aquimarina longa]|uniref:hypothetical protein n=1 Tax=Aquimarina longa TaxID=1080221 RepID=UPI000782A77E|nr:hypothetical protein [Aquimarina longa]
MKKIVSILVFVIIGLTSYAQKTTTLVEDQNPNYKKAMDKFLTNSNEYTLAQGTTLQETYKAIDPLEEKRELRSLRRQYRAQRPYWRHQRRLERARNTTYYENYGYSGFNSGYYNYGSDLLTLGLLGACLIW